MPNPIRRRRLGTQPYPMLSARLPGASYFTVNDSPSSEVGGSDFTLAGWFKADNAAGTEVLVAKGNAGALNEYRFRIAASNLRLAVYDGGSTASSDVVAATSLQNNTWYFAVGIYDHTTPQLKVSVNNGTVGTSTPAVAPISTSTITALGSQGAGNFILTGNLDSFGLWKRQLSGAEIASLYAAGLGVAFRDLSASLQAGLSWWFNFDGSGVDSSRNGNTATPVGNVTYTAGKR